MGWKAIITGWDLDGPTITIGYYDDADPALPDGSKPILYTQDFSRAEVTSDNDLRQQVIQRGKQVRSVYQRVQSLKAAGAINIP
jgi:hypothetical protein